MIMQRRLEPGAPGTRKYIEKYGDRLICVRYKYDFDRKVKLRTVELLESEETWEKKPNYVAPNRTIHVRVEYGEVRLGRLIKAAGGQWNKSKKLWKIPYGTAKSLGLEERIVFEK